MQNNHLSKTKFSELNLNKALLDSLNDSNLTHCTPIQEKSLPITLEGGDIIGQAQTGTGKTFAFLIAMLENIHRNNASTSNQATAVDEPAQPIAEATDTEIADTDDEAKDIDLTQAEGQAQQKTEKKSPQVQKADTKPYPKGLVLAPTRELALQIFKDIKLLNKYAKLNIGLFYGGTGYKQQQQDLENGVDIIIGTPGRIIDFEKQGLLKLDKINVLIMDEADRMFDLGFLKDIRYILRKLPKVSNRLNMLFSATFSYDIQELAYEHMNEPEKIIIESKQTTAKKIEEQLFYPASDEKIALLKLLIDSNDMQRAMIFINTKHIGEQVCETLKALNYKCGILSGDVAQNKREKILEEFREGNINLLVATDVAARGIHIDDVDYVINYDLPNQAEDYVHRIGRTARAGASGYAISFACEEFVFILPEIEEYIGHKIPKQTIDNDALAAIEVPKIEVKRFNKRSTDKGKKPFNKQGKPNQHVNKPHHKHVDREIKSVETPRNTKESNRENRWFSKHGYEIPAFG